MIKFPIIDFGFDLENTSMSNLLEIRDLPSWGILNKALVRIVIYHWRTSSLMLLISRWKQFLNFVLLASQKNYIHIVKKKSEEI